MNEAKQMHDDLMNALLLIVPRTAYHDIRRLNTLVWAIVGLCLTHTVRLGAWAEVLEGRAQYAASRVRHFSHWLHHPAISPPQWYTPVLQAALIDWPLDHRLYVALDTTALTPFVLIRASLVYRGRALSLAWRALRHRSTQVSFEDYRPVLNQVCAIVPAGQVITLLADRGFVHQQFVTYCQRSGWHFRVRLTGDTLVHLEASSASAVKDLCPPTGQKRFFQRVALFGAAVGPVHLALACPVDSPDDPWFVVSDEPTDVKTLDEYGLRFDSEESFLDEKSGGYQIHTSELATPEAAFASSAYCRHSHPPLDESWIGRRPGRETSLGRYPLGSGSELSENWVAMATAAVSAWLASFRPFLAGSCSRPTPSSRLTSSHP